MTTVHITELAAFTDRPDGGNPAGVAVLDAWLPDATMRSIAADVGHPETAFLVPTAERPDGVDASEPAWQLRWFTPEVEMDLCGHATLASGSHVLSQVVPGAPAAHFTTRSGWLSVRRDEGAGLSMDLPARPAERVKPDAWPVGLAAALRIDADRIVAVWKARDLLVVLDTEDELRALSPDPAAVRAADPHAVIVTAPAGRSASDGVDFVSRFFAPNVGIDEDPVTGSAHCTLVPYWAARENRRSLHARQVSARVGDLWCRLEGDRVAICGTVATIGTRTIALPG